MSRVSRGRLLALADELDEATRGLIFDVADLRLMTHRQLAELLRSEASTASPASQARAARRTLARLVELGVLGRLEQVIGGRRAGSMGQIFYPGPVGQRLVAYWRGDGFVRGRVRPEPGSRHVKHRLAISDLYVQVRLAARAGDLDLLAFEAEPDCWRYFVGRHGGRTVLKPDAYVRLGVGAYEESAFVEVDLGTESRPVVARKLRLYLDYFRSGVEQERGVFPRVVVLTNSEARRAALVEVCSRLPAEAWRLFTVSTPDVGLTVLTGDPPGGAR